jgi:pimeloyl-ACP methyl ester carboxylesterase
MARVAGPRWRLETERLLPGAVAGMERDAPTFFATDLPALQGWRVEQETGRVTQPVLYVGGTRSGPWFDEVRALLLAQLPRVRDVMVPGADHALALTHPGHVATAMASFLQEHPMT